MTVCRRRTSLCHPHLPFPVPSLHLTSLILSLFCLSVPPFTSTTFFLSFLPFSCCQSPHSLSLPISLFWTNETNLRGTAGGKTILEARVTSSSWNTGLEVATRTVQWLAFKNDTMIAHAFILTGWMNLLGKFESEMGWPHSHVAMHLRRQQVLLWICCHGHAEVRRHERVDRLAKTAGVTTGLQLDRVEVLRGFLNMTWSSVRKTKRSGLLSTIRGRERSVSNQTIGTVSSASLRMCEILRALRYHLNFFKDFFFLAKPGKIEIKAHFLRSKTEAVFSSWLKSSDCMKEVLISWEEF